MKTKYAGAHLVLRSRYPHRPWNDRDFCVETWRILREDFPATLGIMLMPNHFHLLSATSSEEQLSKSLVHAQGLLTRTLGGSVWERPGAIEIIPDFHHMKRLVRYIHLNPCRKELCRDPLEWEWSTHRDYLGLTSDPALDVEASLKTLGFRSSRASDLFHQYVSADPSVAILGTRFMGRPAQLHAIDLAAAERAAAVSLRSSLRDVRTKGRLRGLVLRTLVKCMGIPRQAVANHFGVHRRTLSYDPAILREERQLSDALKGLLIDPRLQGK